MYDWELQEDVIEYFQGTTLRDKIISCCDKCFETQINIVIFDQVYLP